MGWFHRPRSWYRLGQRGAQVQAEEEAGGVGLGALGWGRGAGMDAARAVPPGRVTLTCVHSCQQAPGEKGWTQGWNNTETVQGSAQDLNAQLGCRAWPGRSSGDGDGDTHSTLLGNIAVACHGASCPCPLPPAASRRNCSTEPPQLTAEHIGAALSPGAPALPTQGAEHAERVAMHVMSLSGHGKLSLRNTSKAV